MATATKDPQSILIRGRLSWPKFTYAEALKQNASSKFPKKDEDVRPNFQLLLDETQADKLVTHVRDVFLPWCVEQGKNKDKSGLTEAQAKKITKVLDEADWEVDGVMGLIKPVHEKTKPLAPEAVMSVPVNGFKGQDLTLKAIVRSESELANPTDDLIIPERGMILPVADTTHELYPGSIVAAELNLFAFVGANVGITASTSDVVFIRDADRFGGGGGIDEDELFMDLDD